MEQVLAPVVRGLGFEWWGAEHLAAGRHTTLRVYIDAAAGITLDDCATVSRQLSGVLDVENLIGGAYTLEVSSPGLNRLLFEPGQFERYTGHTVKLQLREIIDGRRNITGTLDSVADGGIVVLTEARQYSVPFDSIEKARLVPDK